MQSALKCNFFIFDLNPRSQKGLGFKSELVRVRVNPDWSVDLTRI